MKKLLALLMALLVLVSCASGGESKTTDKEVSKDKTQETSPTKKVEVLLMVGSLGDLSFNDSAWEGVQRVGKDFSDKVNVNIVEYGSDPTKEEPALLEAAEGNADLIIASSTMKTYIEKHGADFPDKKFIIFDETIDYAQFPLKNVASIQYKANEASYLVGFVGAKMSKTGVLGFLGGMDLAIINDFLLGFIEGAQAANPDIKVMHSFAGSWADPAKGKEQSLAMVGKNADVIFGVAGGTGMGAIELAAERGFYALGVDSDQALVLKAQEKENLSQVILTSALKNVGESLYRAVDLFLKDELKFGEAEVLGIKENGVGLAVNEYYEKLVPQEIRNEVEALREKVVSGEIQISSAYGKTTEEIDQIRTSVQP